jgi:peptidoglycan hydrolase CwlO-like protein
MFIGLSLLVSCAPSVPKAVYDKALSDISSAQTQVTSLQKDLSAAQEKIDSLQKDLSSSQEQVKTAQTQIDSLKKDLSLSQEKLKKSALYMDISNAIFIPAIKGQELTQSQQLALFLQGETK